jgi:hypothetical protein
MYVGLEILHRQTFTDYIDDVSTSYIDQNLYANYLTPEQTQMALQLNYRQGFNPSTPTTRRTIQDPQRGDATQNDAYFSAMFRIGWRLNDWNSPNGRAIRQMRCPSYY